MKKTTETYIFADRTTFPFKTSSEEIQLENQILKDALIKADEMITRIVAFDIDISRILGMRNLSAFIGEVYARAIVMTSNELFIGNPHQDGYPDLLIMNDDGKKEMERLKNNLRDKKPFSPFVHGGLEVKATCGSVPTPAVLQRKGLFKPDIGENRIDMMIGYDWKAHHRETNNLIGILWDFIGGKPTIVAVFYSDKLTENDWGNIIAPKVGGGRTTSVSIMTRIGIGKMYAGWIAVHSDSRYAAFINKYNSSNLIPVERALSAQP